MDILRVQFLVQDLEDEVNNGGLHQYFFNSAGDNALETVVALERIGAAHTANILRAAIAKFPNGFLGANRNERQDILEIIAPEVDEFEELDNQFFEYYDDLAALSEALTGS